MRIPAQALPRNFRRSPVLVFGFLVGAILLAYKTSAYVLAGDTTSLIFVAMAAVGGAVAVAVLNNWRNGLYMFLAWLLFEDLVRKYLGNNMAVYFAKDILVAVVYVSYFAALRRKETQSFRPPFLVPLLLLFWLGVLQAFNPASTSLIFGGLGLKLYFYYVPLIFVGYSLLESEADLRRFFLVNLGLAVIIGGLGIIQAIAGHTFLNPEHPAEDIRELSTLYREAPISHVLAYRPTSVFVSAGRFQDYLIVMWLLTFGFGGYLLLRRRKGRILTALVVAILAAAIVLTTSRGVFLWTIASALVGAAAFLWGAPWRQGQALRVIRALQRTVLMVGLAVITLMVAYPEALSPRLAVYSETLSPYSPASELTYRARDYPLKNFLLAFEHPRWPYGYGIGTASLGGQYVSRILRVKSPVIGVENGFGTLIVEMGILGLLFWIVMSTAIVLSGWKVVRKLKGSPWFPIGFVIFWYAFLLLIPLTYTAMQAYQDFVLNAYLWLLLGVLFRLPSIAASSQLEAAAAASQPRRRWIL